MSDIKDKHVYLEQVGLKQLGFDPGPLDGDRGPKTNGAFSRWEASLITSTPTTTIAEKLVDLARTQVGIFEVSRNQAPGIAKYWTATTYPNGMTNREPWCAAFTCWLVKTAVGDTPIKWSLPKSPVAYDNEKWGAANEGKGVHVLKSSEKPKAGDIFTLATASHTGLVIGVSGSNVTTIEGNTNAAGSREGDGVYIKTRPISTIRKFIRIL